MAPLQVFHPGETAAILLGASDWVDGLPGGAPLLNSSAGFRSYVTDELTLGLSPARDILNLFDDEGSREYQIHRIGAFLEERSQLPLKTIIVHYVGHGTVISDANFAVLLRNSSSLDLTKLRMLDLAEVIRSKSPRSKMIIFLDCCYSGTALRDFIWGVLGGISNPRYPDRGTIVYCSSPSGGYADDGGGGLRTTFTAALLEAVYDFSLDTDPPISFRDLDIRVRAAIRRTNRDDLNLMPQLHELEQAIVPLVSLPAFPNPKSAPPTLNMEKRLREAAVNPHYTKDLAALHLSPDIGPVVSPETIVIVVGTTVMADLLDRPAAALLRDEIDRRGDYAPGRRAITVTDQGWYQDRRILGSNAVIALGGPPANRLSAEFDNWEPENVQRDGKYVIRRRDNLMAFYRQTVTGVPQAAVWGINATATRDAVDLYMRDSRQGLGRLLSLAWK